MQEIHDKNISELYKKTGWVLLIFHFISGSNVAWNCPAAYSAKGGVREQPGRSAYTVGPELREVHIRDSFPEEVIFDLVLKEN